MSAGVLLTVSGVVPPDLDADVAAGRRPRADHRLLAGRLGATVLDHTAAFGGSGHTAAFGGSRWAGLARRLVGDELAFAAVVAARAHRFEVVVTDAERTGLPVAAALRVLGLVRRRRPRHVMVTHVLSSRRKLRLARLLGLAAAVDRFVVYSSSQERVVLDGLGVGPERVVRLAFGVDSRFFRPEPCGSPHAEPAADARPTISAAGLERRDYATLCKAVEGQPVEVVIAAASPWARAGRASAFPIPANVTVTSLDPASLRDLYARSRFVVVPLEDVDFQAGVTTILEAMAMGRAVVHSGTAGQTDVVHDGETGVIVPVGDAVALHRTIEALLADPCRTAAMGAAGRRHVEQHHRIEDYVEALAEIVEAAR